MEPIVELVKAVALVLSPIFAWLAARHSKRTNRDLQTNHGKRTGEYLEMIQDLRDDLALHQDQDLKQFNLLRRQVANVRKER